MTTLYRLWGKTNERDKDKGDNWKWRSHPAICHMVDVAYVAETWLQLNPRLMDRFCQLAPGIDREDLLRIIVTIIALHDLGKLHRCFQAKSDEGWEAGYKDFFKERPNGKGFDHGLGSARFIRHLADNDLSFLSWFDWLFVIDSVAAHHGRLYGEELTSPEKEHCLPDPFEEQLVITTIQLLCRLFGTSLELPKAPTDNRFAMLLAGFCSVVDWFGSNSEVFTFAPEVQSDNDLEDYLQTLRDSGKAEKQFQDAGLISHLVKTPPTYQDLFEFIDSDSDLHPLQYESLKVPFGNNLGSEIVIVEAPMGSGKTELALFLASQAIGQANAEGIYFALPTQASSNALLERIDGFARKITQQDYPVSLTLAHGGRKYNAEYQSLREAYYRVRNSGSDYKDKDSEPAEVIAPSWLQSSKRTLLSAIGVGTIDQTMLGAICARHSFVRLFALANKVVIFDEIHAYDSYMNVLIKHLLAWLGALGTKVILLSATLPRTLRKELLESYGVVDTNDRSSNQMKNYDPYPLMVYGSKSGTLRFVPQTQKQNDKTIQIHLLPASSKERTQVGVETAMYLASNGGCIAWIRNTVREAQEAWQMLTRIAQELPEEQRPIVRTLHARFVRNDRNQIERELVKQLGKNGGTERPKRIIVVATQVIEQSVDLDFDAMISDLAPADLMLQRSGRLWRHSNRPTEERHQHTSPCLYILTPNEEELNKLEFGSSSYVYDAETILRSARLVQEATLWRMPDACRTVVADLYDRNNSYWTEEQLRCLPEHLEKARARYQRVENTMEGTANTILVCPPYASSLNVRWYTVLNDDADTNIAIATRYGGSSLTCVLIQQVGSGFRLIGKPDLALHRLPEPDNCKEEITFEEGIELSSVSFPWYKQDKVESVLPTSLQPFLQWWQSKRPYDKRFFLLVQPDGSISHPLFTGTYQLDALGEATQGLVIEENKSGDQDELIKYETL